MFRGGNKIRISDSLLRRVRRAAELLGCTAEEFIERALEREAEHVLSLVSQKQYPAVTNSQQEGIA